jgi:hypothetical protein
MAESEAAGESRAARIARAGDLLKAREFGELGRLLRPLYFEQVPPRDVRSQDDPVARLLRRYSAVLCSFFVTLPLWALFGWAGFAYWHLAWPAWSWLVVSLGFAYYLAAMVGYSFWRPRQGTYVWLFLGTVVANTAQWVSWPPARWWELIVAHLLGAFAVAMILRAAARHLALSALGAKLAYVGGVSVAAYALWRQYGANPWILPFLGISALLAGPALGALFPPQAVGGAAAPRP